MAREKLELSDVRSVPISDANYEDFEHVRETRDFLNAPDRFLWHFQ